MTIARPEILSRWLLRSQKGPNVTIDGHKMEGLRIDIVRRWQQEFQQDFCGSCVHFDATRQRFKRKGHQNISEDCCYHWMLLASAGI